jgi:hypothetical protein
MIVVIDSEFLCALSNLIGRRERLPRKQPASASSVPFMLRSFALLWFALGFWATPIMAQHTTVEKNGLAGTIETDYNAAGKASEMRTIDTDGKLQQRVQYEYLPGNYVPNQTDTTYWPNGQMRKVVRKTYDENANFIGEFIQIFDESGKQIAGHKLTHDPWAGTYRCLEWNTAAQDYRAVECPSGEEESGGNSAPRSFTYNEVMKHLDAARKTARQEWEFARLRAAAPIKPHTEVREVGIVLPAKVNPGERVSGSVVENPDQYAEMAEVTVTRVAVPFESAGDGSRLSGWLLETPGENPRRADGPITFIVPQRGSQLTVTFRLESNHAHSVSQTLSVSQLSRKESHPPNSFQVAALCMKGELCAVSGTFNGDSSKTFAAFEDRPATIVAETSDAAYVGIPEPTGPGSHPLFMAEGSKVVALPVVVGEFYVRNNGREIQAGESLIAFPTLEGPGDIPDTAWQRGNFPDSNLERARRLIPGFELTGSLCRSREKGEAEEKREVEEKEKEQGKKDSREEGKEEKQDGEILIVIKNLAPEQTSLHGSRNGTVVFCLSDEAFQRGAFKYDLRVDAQKAGKVNAVGSVIPFLAPVEGREFAVEALQ